MTRSTNGTLSVYRDNSDTQTTTGVTDGEDTDSLTGVHRFAVATTDSFYTPGSQFFVILSAATIDGATVNAPVATFTIGKTGCVRRGTAQSATGSTIVLDAAAALGDDIVNGSVVQIVGGTGIHQSRVITDYVTATDTATVSPDWTTNPDSTSVFAVWVSPPAPTSVAGLPAVNLTHWLGTAAATPTVAGVPEVDLTHIGGTAVTAASGIPEVKVASIATGAVSTILTTAMTEAYAADGAAPTVAQALFAIQQFLQEKSISGTTCTVKKLDGSTTAMTFTLNDATTPTSLTRAS